ncbi:hypothetical protein FBU30_003673 [Linnemannia zychae]|nr:hypothetical protein FBU30_003673 [Linnemannia zychae]
MLKVLGGTLLLAFSHLLMGKMAIAQDTSAAVHPHIAISTEFPNTVAGVTPSLVSGRDNSLQVTLHNSDSKDLTVKTIEGSIADLHDFTIVTHKLTPFRYDRTLKAHSTLVLSYKINVIHPSRDVGLTLLANMVGPDSLAHQPFSALVFNSTVHFNQPASSWFDWKLILGSMLVAGVITAVIMTGMAYKDKLPAKMIPVAFKKEEKKNIPKMSAMDRYSVLADTKARDIPISEHDEKLSAAPSMGTTVDRSTIPPEMRSENGNLATGAPDVFANEEPVSLLSHMKALENERDKDKNIDPELSYHQHHMRASEMANSADRNEILADMKATRRDDTMNVEDTVAPTRAL